MTINRLRSLPYRFNRFFGDVQAVKRGRVVDELMELYLSDRAPDHLVFDPAEVLLEIRGSRGEFHMSRLEEAEFRFRECLVQGLSIGAAAEQAMDTHDQARQSEGRYQSAGTP